MSLPVRKKMKGFDRDTPLVTLLFRLAGGEDEMSYQSGYFRVCCSQVCEHTGVKHVN